MAHKIIASYENFTMAASNLHIFTIFSNCPAFPFRSAIVLDFFNVVIYASCLWFYVLSMLNRSPALRWRHLSSSTTWGRGGKISTIKQASQWEIIMNYYLAEQCHRDYCEISTDNWGRFTHDLVINCVWARKFWKCKIYGLELLPFYVNS